MSINTIALVGRMVADPSLRYSPSGNAFCSFTLAVSDGWGDDQKTYFVEHLAIKKRAETIAEHCRKGSHVGIKGKLTTRTYKNKEDKTVKVTEIFVEDIQFLTPANTQGSGQSDHTGHSGTFSDPFEDPFARERTIDISDDMLPF